MRIGIYGGTFNPIHFAHLHDIAYACENADLDICHVVVAGDPWQKPNIEVDAMRRLKWVQTVTSAYFPGGVFESRQKKSQIIIDDREIVREGKTYTIDTLRSLKKQYENDEYVLIVGDDVPENIKTWKDHDEILKMVELFIIPRSIMPISSTYIRDQVKAGKTIRGLVPMAVEIDIFDHFLYTKEP